MIQIHICQPMKTADSIRKAFGSRLKRARAMQEISLQSLADKLGGDLSRQALHKYEQGKAMPDSARLVRICDALEVGPDDLLAEPAAPVGKLHFRKRAAFGKRKELRLRFEVEDQLHRLRELADVLGEPLRADKVFNKPIPAKSADEAEAAAKEIRKQWNLGEDALPSLVALLEDRGVILHSTHAEKSLDGAATWLGDTPVIVLARWLDDDLPRKRFTLAHELAHLVLDIPASTPARTAEAICHRFAGALLVPDTTLRHELGGRRRHALFDIELVNLKERYGISIAALARRMSDLGLVSASVHKDWTIRRRRINRHLNEPGSWKGSEQPSRFPSMLYRALAEETISLSKAAALDGKPIADFRRSLQANAN